jgi:Predicted exporters of the RND superfamily
MAVLRTAVALLANVTVLTALLVYFGWRRSETQTQRLGIDESILGASTRDYLLRSVHPVLVLLVGVVIVGLGWVALDRRLAPYLAARPDSQEPHLGEAILRLLGAGWLILPALVWIGGFQWRAAAYVLFPASIGIGVLLHQYAAHLRSGDSPPDRTTWRRTTVSHAVAALLAGICLFWTASNYAEVDGARLARLYVSDLGRLPGVVVYSQHRLHLEGPGVFEHEFPGTDPDSMRYRYQGLRLFEHTGGRFFLISDGWTSSYGVVFMLRDGDESIRLDFVRDRRAGESPSG